MRTLLVAALAVSLALSVSPLSLAQTSTSAPAGSAVPSLVNYSGVLKNASGHQLASATGVTFLIYKDEQGGAPLWLETQSVTPDRLGHYSVQLGAASKRGLPADLFSANEARWLAVQIANEAEQPRTLLVAVPYAMKAADAATIGGLPPSAFVLAGPAATVSGSSPASVVAGASGSAAPPASPVTTSGGTVNAIPLFTTATNIENSILTQTAATTVNVVGKLNLPANGVATAATGKNSRPEALVASAFDSSTSAAVTQAFQLQAEPAGNNTATPSGTLNLLFGSGPTAPAETGFKISNTGLLTFATGQTFPGAGTLTGITTAAGSGLSGGGTTGTLSLGLLTTCAANQILKWSGTAWMCAGASSSGGTVKSVALTAPAGDFTVSGSPVTTTGTLGLAWTVAPTSANTADAIVKRDSGGNFSANTVTANDAMLNGATVNGVAQFNGPGAEALFASAPGTGATTIYGAATATSGAGWGVEAQTNSSDAGAYGLIGYASSATGSPVAVYGEAVSPTGVGVFGQDKSESATGKNFVNGFQVSGVGIWGDAGTSPGIAFSVGVVGTVDDAVAGAFASNSPYASFNPTLWAVASGGGSPFYVQGTTGYCEINGAGTLICNGQKNTVVPVDGGKRTVAVSAIESPQNWFEDFGSSELVNGLAVVQLDTTFTQTVNTEKEYFVIPVPNGDCKGLYVSNRTASSFEVHELGGGTSSIHFTYRITAIRKNYETVRFADHTQETEMHRRMTDRMKAGAAHPVSHDPTKKLQTMSPIAAIRPAAR